MEKLLSICIPTFNRANELDRQLSWLAQEIQAFGLECEVIVSDNCSDDSTPEIISQWQPAFAHTTFKTHRHSENVGWMRNFIYCLGAASGHFTWIVGDDDVIYEGALARVVQALRNQPELALMYLNFTDYNPLTGEVLAQHWFDPDLEQANGTDGKTIFQRCMQNIGSVIFITATIYRTQFAREALQRWPDCFQNWAGLAYWSGYCATQGSVFITRDNYLECTVGMSYWQKDPKAWFKIRHWDIPELYTKLQQEDYPVDFCRRGVFKIAQEDVLSRNVLGNLKYALWCFLKSPRWTTSIVTNYIRILGLVTLSGKSKTLSPQYALTMLSN